MNRSQRLLRSLALVLPLSLVAAACGGSDSTDTADATDSESTTAAGEVFVSGSSTVEPISVRVAELFEDIAPDVFVDVEGPGTGDGFKKFCAGESDISDASRQIKDAEIADCEANGIGYTEILVGIDGIAVMTSTNNDAIDCVTFENLYGLIGPESNDIDTWAAANGIAGEGLPEAPLEIFGPGPESGTYDSFIEIVLEADTTLGWVGFAFAANSGAKLLEVDGGDGCVAPTAETIASNEYPISRNLYIYVNNAKAETNPGLQAYVDFYVGEGLDTAVAEVGYVELTDDAKSEVRAAWG